MKDLELKLQAIYGSDLKLSRLYLCKDGRKRVDLITPTWRKTVQLARAILEANLGRSLVADETVDHIDGDKTNDDVSNLRVLSLGANSADSVIRLAPQSFICPTCGIDFTIQGLPLRHAIRSTSQGKSGPFCGRRCRGLYGAAIQNGKRDKATVATISKVYFTKKG